MSSKEPDWVADIAKNNRHRLFHDTSFERTLGILKTREIFGGYGQGRIHESYAHFCYEGWYNFNYLPIRGEHGRIRLFFEVSVPVRYRGQGNQIPEPGWLELYATLADTPWQCCLHPESGSLTFVGSEPSYRDINRNEVKPWKRLLRLESEEAKLERLLSWELNVSCQEGRQIQPAIR